jgi:hypothetical protein
LKISKFVKEKHSHRYNVFPALDGTFLSGINSHSNEEDPTKNKMLGWIA